MINCRNSWEINCTAVYMLYPMTHAKWSIIWVTRCYIHREQQLARCRALGRLYLVLYTEFTHSSPADSDSSLFRKVDNKGKTSLADSFGGQTIVRSTGREGLFAQRDVFVLNLTGKNVWDWSESFIEVGCSPEQSVR